MNMLLFTEMNQFSFDNLIKFLKNKQNLPNNWPGSNAANNMNSLVYDVTQSPNATALNASKFHTNAKR